MTRRRSLPRGLFGLLCVTVAVVVLSGVRDGSWSVLSWAVPLGLIGTGAAALAGALRRPSRQSTS
jgi:hypothetical protein